MSIRANELSRVTTIGGNDDVILVDPSTNSGSIINAQALADSGVPHGYNDLKQKVAALGGGTPAAAKTVSEMTDKTRLYVYTGSEAGYTAGNWYYWNGSAWTSGGAYGDIALDDTLTVQGAAADAKATGDAIGTAGKSILGLYPVESASGDIAVIHDGADDLPVRDLSVAIEPVQSLNGYDKPWAGGAGKNQLTPTAPAGTVNGITYTVNSDGSIKASGTATAQAVRNFFNNVTPASVGLADGEYILSGCPAGGSNDKYALRVVTTKASGSTTVSDYGSGATFTIDSSVTAIRVYLYVGSGQTVNNIVFYPMIRKASETDATYEPYSNICPISGWDAVKVARTAQNLLPNNYTETVFSRNGITFTVSNDGVVTANGTATAGTYFNFSGWEYDTLPFMHRPGLRLRLSGSYPGVITRIQTRPYGSSTTTTIATDTGTGADFTVPDDVRAYALFINITSGQTVTNATFYPVISVTDEGQPNWSPSEAEVTDVTLPTTVYGGTLDVTTGVLTVTKGLIASYAGETLPGAWISDRDVYAAGTTPTTGAQVVYDLASHQTYTLTPTEVKTLLGENRIYADAGQVTVQYRADGTYRLTADGTGTVTIKLARGTA